MSKIIDLLTKGSGLSEGDVRSIVSNAPSRYKTYTIPKRNGGERLISQPAREVKLFQRILVMEILSSLPVHGSALAYREGKSIRDNAEAHVHGGAILKFDFKEFFPSITSRDWWAYCKKNNLFENDDDITTSAKILFRRTKYGSVLRLAIGAPSSPFLSNILMAEFDSKIFEAVSADNVTYTRYADDLTFSAKRAGNLSGVESVLRKIIRETSSPHLRINEKKTVFSTKKFRRVVTGLVLSDDGEVSLGHKRKREIRATLHHYVLGKLDDQESLRLAGLLAFVNAVEPTFLLRLTEKYGHEIIRQLKERQYPYRTRD